MNFTWNPEKAVKVLAEHRINFAKIIDIFEDSFSLDLIDDKHSNPTELRFIIVGRTVEYGLVYLVYIMPTDDEIHFVTARKAEKWYVKQYEENLRRT
ncbi:MAG: BrnT family toxin [Acidobacteria bacterium]|nr:BrnT family toxin [Acidobacteriota bacterium]